MDEMRRRFVFCAPTGRPEKINLSGEEEQNTFRPSELTSSKPLGSEVWQQAYQTVQTLWIQNVTEGHYSCVRTL